MARNPRFLSNSKVYHIILKGIDSQDIFYDDNRIHIKKVLYNKSKKYGLIIKGPSPDSWKKGPSPNLQKTIEKINL